MVELIITETCVRARDAAQRQNIPRYHRQICPRNSHRNPGRGILSMPVKKCWSNLSSQERRRCCLVTRKKPEIYKVQESVVKKRKKNHVMFLLSLFFFFLGCFLKLYLFPLNLVVTVPHLLPECTPA